MRTKHFGADLATRALALAERFVDYRVAWALEPQAGRPTALRNSLNARERLRERYFAPEEHEALFARESALDRYTLARLEIQHNNGLTEEEKPAHPKTPRQNCRQSSGQTAPMPWPTWAPRYKRKTLKRAAWTIAPLPAAQRHLRHRRRTGPGAPGWEERAWNQKDDYAAAKAHDPGQMQRALRANGCSPQEQLRLEAAWRCGNHS